MCADCELVMLAQLGIDKVVMLAQFGIDKVVMLAQLGLVRPVVVCSLTEQGKSGPSFLCVATPSSPTTSHHAGLP